MKPDGYTNGDDDGESAAAATRVKVACCLLLRLLLPWYPPAAPARGTKRLLAPATRITSPSYCDVFNGFTTFRIQFNWLAIGTKKIMRLLEEYRRHYVVYVDTGWFYSAM
ncbi:hypothetical protein JYU34_015546 [Plutella xylostella]|uniref:Uncharacterized protein n=1 Tax=Plutella xylostella TaxID=51655 RepID=A0ABQ7Q8U3_PLUXY|nr:hypothetical protein JYU34_015546 [Plutella xylostella]